MEKNGKRKRRKFSAEYKDQRAHVRKKLRF